MYWQKMPRGQPPEAPGIGRRSSPILSKTALRRSISGGARPQATDAVALAAAAPAFVSLGSDPKNALARDTENGLVDFHAPHALARTHGICARGAIYPAFLPRLRP